MSGPTGRLMKKRLMCRLHTNTHGDGVCASWWRAPSPMCIPHSAFRIPQPCRVRHNPGRRRLEVLCKQLATAAIHAVEADDIRTCRCASPSGIINECAWGHTDTL